MSMTPPTFSSGARRAKTALRSAGVWSCVLALLGSIGCNSNFIPVPPPGDPTFQPVEVSDATGVRQLWQVSGAGDAMRNARVFVFNGTLKVGVISQADATGSFTTGLLDGSVGDRVELRYETTDGEQSPVICRLLVVGTSRTPCP